LAAPVTAQPDGPAPVHWRGDYNTARREAADKDRPLVIDFGTENCYWCKRLDASTFREPAVVRLLNERFIPLKIDADKEAPLAQALRVQSYPTLVLAGPDGKILAVLEGYQEAGPFLDHLHRALASLANPEWMARDYQEAAKAVAAGDYARAVALLKAIAEDGKDRPVQAKARQLLRDVERQAADRLARARPADAHRPSGEAVTSLTEVSRAFAGTQAAAEANRLLATLSTRPEVRVQQRAHRAKELLAQARADYRAQQYLCCLDRCETLAAQYGDLPEAAEALQLAADLKGNPEWLRQVCDSLGERLGLMYLAQAETWLKKDQPQQAVLCLERVVQMFPGTRHAEVAQVRLTQIQGQPTRTVDFKKP
jgi:tetratricopeptide (TPR) repeat protein